MKQTRIALLHIDRLASTCLDPKSDTRCVEIIERLDDLTSLNVASYTLNHLSAVCRIASPDQIQAIISWLVNAMMTQESAIYRVFRSATFFEVRPIRDGFFATWIKAVVENVAKAFEPENSAAKEIQILLGEVAGSDPKATTERIDILIRNKHAASFKTKSKGRQELNHLISGLCLFPIHYFTVTERRQIVTILYIMHRMVSKKDDTRQEFLARVFAILDYFVDECQDSFVMVRIRSLNFKIFFTDCIRYILLFC
jgi:hypothetical protein